MVNMETVNMLESEVQSKIKQKLTKLGFILFRNNVGAWRHKSGRWIQYGLCKGSSDLIGWRPLIITADMIGKKIAQFVAIETKRNAKSKATEKQINFVDTVQKSGGVGIIASSFENLKEYL
jgi:hypothetical protein